MVSSLPSSKECVLKSVWFKAVIWFIINDIDSYDYQIFPPDMRDSLSKKELIEQCILIWCLCCTSLLVPRRAVTWSDGCRYSMSSAVNRKDTKIAFYSLLSMLMTPSDRALMSTGYLWHCSRQKVLRVEPAGYLNHSHSHQVEFFLSI